MNWSLNKKMFKATVAIVAIALLVNGFQSFGQTEEMRQSKSVSITTTEDGKVKLRVEMKEGNDTKTFEKTYDNYAEIHQDPDLEKHGIELDGWSFGGGNAARSFGWNADSFMQGFDMGTIRKQMEEMMRGGFTSNNFFFDFDNDAFSGKMDSLSNQLNFHFRNGKMYQNGEEVVDIDSLKEVLKNRFGNMNFDFDFGGADGRQGFSGWDLDEEEDGFHVISRARVYVRPAKDKDKETVGADKMEDLEIKDISFYPNPSDGRFNLEIETTNKEALVVKIVSPMGDVIYEKTEQGGVSSYSFDIDISNEKEGLYILQVIQNNKTLTKRVIIE